jgi:parallel beta-helix repeat protein
MKRLLVLLFVLILVASSASMLPVKAEGRTIVVPDDYPTVSLAVQSAAAGDTVHVKEGAYHEQALELTKSISLIGEGVDKTTLYLNPPLVKVGYMMQWIWIPDTAIKIGADDVKIEGFSINLPDDSYDVGSAIHAVGDRISIISNQVGNRSIYLQGSSLNITGNSVAGTIEAIGSHQIIAYNTLKDNLKIQGSYNQIYGNIISGYYFGGIHLNGSFNCFVGNSFSSMEIDDSNSNNFIVDNSFSRLVMQEFGNGGCSDNTVSKNRVTGNGGFNDGIHLWKGSNNTFSANTIRDCQTGLTIGDSNSISGGNLVFLNNFLNNSEQHVNANHTVNRLDNGAKGNYYDDYRGNDVNGDGVGDSPYTLQEIHWDQEQQKEVTIVYFQDNYPLTAPVNIDSINVDLPSWASLSSNEASDGDGSAEPLSIVPIALAVAVGLSGVGLLVYFKKYRKQDWFRKSSSASCSLRAAQQCPACRLDVSPSSVPQCRAPYSRIIRCLLCSVSFL